MYEVVELSDYELVLKVRQGSSESMELLLDRYSNFILYKCKSRYMKGSEWCDLVQEANIGLYKAVTSYDPSKGSFKSHALRSISAGIISALKKANRNKHNVLNNAVHYSSVSISSDSRYDSYFDYLCYSSMGDVCSAEDTYIMEEESEVFLSRLPEVLSPFELRVSMLYIEGYTLKEIANRTCTNTKSVDNAVQRIKRKIAKEFQVAV